MLEVRYLSNKMPVVLEQTPSDNIISIGIFVKAGSNYETLSTRGMSHFVEHMLFKGTTSKSAKDIAIISDRIGGMLNAYTGKDMTCFYIKTTSDNLSIALELMADMVLNSEMDPFQIENEKKVIIEEIAMYEDSHEDYVHEKLEEKVWEGNSLAFPILGLYETVSSFNEASLKDFINEFYLSQNTVISVSGSFETHSILYLLEHFFANYKTGSSIKTQNQEMATFKPISSIKRKKAEQAYLSMAFEGALYDSEDRYPYALLSGALGQSMSSRLFQVIREEKALVYNIGSTNEFYQTGGIFNIYAGSSPEKYEEMIDSIGEIIMDVYTKGLSIEEIQRSKDQILCSMLLGMETTDSIMMSNGRNMLLRGRPLTRKEAIEKVEKTTKEDVDRIVKKYLDWDKKAVSAIRPYAKKKKTKV